MFWTILVSLVTLWLLGLVTSHTLGGLIHALPVTAVVLLGVRLASGAVQASLVAGDSFAAGEESAAGRNVVFVSGVTDTEEYHRAVGLSAIHLQGPRAASKARVAGLRASGHWVDDSRSGTRVRAGDRAGARSEGWDFAVASTPGATELPARFGPAFGREDAGRVAWVSSDAKQLINEALAGGMIP